MELERELERDEAWEAAIIEREPSAEGMLDCWVILGGRTRWVVCSAQREVLAKIDIMEAVMTRR